MSLIQQALKRKTDEQQGKSVPPPPPLTGSPLAVPPPLATPVPPMPAPPASPLHPRLSLASSPPPVAEKPAAMLPPLSTVPPPLSGTGFTPAGATSAPPATQASPPDWSGPARSQAPASEGQTESNGGRRKRFLLAVLLIAVLGVGTLQVRKYMGTRQPPPPPEVGRGAPPGLKTTDGTAATPAGQGQSVAATTPSTKGTGSTSLSNATHSSDTPGLLPMVNVGEVHKRVDQMKDLVAEARAEGIDPTGKGGSKPAAVVQPSSSSAAQGATPVRPVVEVSAATAPTAPKATPVAPVAAPPSPAANAGFSFPTPGSAAGTPSAAAQTPAPAQNVVWPNVKISGVMAHASFGQRSAIVNDVLVNVGESVDGMTIIEVRENAVVMEFKGATRSFNVGRRR